jgi:hypothetical protein
MVRSCDLAILRSGDLAIWGSGAGHSSRRAVIGSTREALIAGIAPDSSATAMITDAASAIVCGSSGDTPNNMPVISRLPAQASGRPTTTPHAAMLSVSRRTIRSTAARGATRRPGYLTSSTTLPTLSPVFIHRSAAGASANGKVRPTSGGSRRTAAIGS